MMADNLVYRLPDPADRRRVLIHMTERGLQLQRRLAERIEGEVEEMLGGRSPLRSPSSSSCSISS